MDFLKKIFKREPSEITLNSIELQDYLDEISPKILNEEYEVIKKDLFSFEDNLTQLKQKLNDLEKIEINANEREKLFFEGNKKAYLTKLYKFIENIFNDFETFKNKEIDIDKLEKFCIKFQELLENLNKDVAKNYSIISHYIDLRDSNSNLKKLDDLIKDINDFLNEGKISEYKKITHLIKQLNEKKIFSEKIKNEIQELEQEYKINKEKKDISEKKLTELKESQDYITYKKLLNEKDSILLEIKNLNSKINNDLKPIDKELKKYAHESLKNEIIFEYLNNPLEALEKDAELKILHMLEQIKLNLDLQLEKEYSESKKENEDKKAKKAIKQLSLLNREYFENIKKQYLKLKNDKELIEGVLSRSTIIMEIKDLEYQIEHFSKKIIELETEIKKKKEKLKDLEKINKEKLEKMLYEFTEQKIIILE